MAAEKPQDQAEEISKELSKCNMESVKHFFEEKREQINSWEGKSITEWNERNKEKVKSFTENFDAWAEASDELVYFSKLVGVNPGAYLFAIMEIVGFFLVISFAWELFVTFFIYLMPAYASVRAIENKEESGKKDQQQWTIYWMVYAMINMAENFLPFIVNCIPYYGWVRIALLLQVSTIPSTTLYLL